MKYLWGSGSKRWIYGGIALILGGIATAIWGQGLLKRPRVRRERHKQQAGNPTGDAPVRTPQPGDILLFFRPNRLRDHVIEWVTGSRFYHAALYIAPGCMLEARPKGVNTQDMKGREGRYVVLPAPHGKGEAALAWARTQIGASFDTTDLLVIGLEHLFTDWHINYTKPGSYTCAELVTEAYRHAGVDLAPGKDADEVAPSDLAELLPDEQRTAPKPA